MLHLVNMGLRYGRSKGVREHRLEEPPLGSLAAPCHLEESASHHLNLFLLDPHQNSDGSILSTSQKKTSLCINSFAPR